MTSPRPTPGPIPGPPPGSTPNPASGTPSEPPPGPAIRPVIVAPTFNNAATLPDVLVRCRSLDLPVIVVNDGSTDTTAEYLAAYPNDPAAGSRNDTLVVETHPINRGKAEALQTGFATARSRGFTHAITIDTDGQLDPEEIPDLVDAARRHPDALIMGTRDASRDDYPGRSRLGRRVSNWAIRLETGVRVDDCQCGLRVYPLHVLDVVQCRAGRFAFEVEVITRAIWAGADVISVPVTCRYFQGDARVSHLKPVRDTLHGVLLHSALLARCALPIAHRRFTPFADDHD